MSRPSPSSEPRITWNCTGSGGTRPSALRGSLTTPMSSTNACVHRGSRGALRREAPKVAHEGEPRVVLLHQVFEGKVRRRHGEPRLSADGFGGDPLIRDPRPRERLSGEHVDDAVTPDRVVVWIGLGEEEVVAVEDGTAP